MSSLLPVAVFGLEVPPGEVMIPVAADFPATIRITMAAVDPTEDPEPDEDGNVPSVPRSTLRIVKPRMGDLDEDDEDDDEYLQALLANGDDDEEDSDDEEDEEANGGPSDPAKSKKARQEAAIRKLLEATQDEDDEDEEMEDDGAPNGTSKKGKGLALDDDEEEDEDEDEDEDDSDDEDGLDLEQFVICTLDTERHYQQTIDITIPENEKAYFVVSGTHSVYITGNYVIDEDEETDSEDEDDDEYDLPPDMEDLVGDSDREDELDELDLMERVEEVDTDEEAPQLVQSSKKGKKRSADEAENLDDMIAKESKTDETKLSKKQQKKLKNNKGEAVGVEEPKSAIKETAAPSKTDKKVQFAKNLELGPTGSAEKAKQADKGKKATTGVKVVQGVTIDDRKIGTGRAVKSGDRVSMRYIGKLQDGKVFDSNKKGTPFSFKVGKGEVIKGWDIGIAGMAVGGERRLTIPANLAYGNKKLDGIPANSTLIFDVKLLEIK